MNKTFEWPALWWVPLLLATAYQVLFCFKPPAFLVFHAMVLDDAFYYLQTARNVANLGWVTFDGIHATSGVQLLWEGLLSLLALIFPARVEFLRATLLFSALLNFVTGCLFYHVGTALYSKSAGAFATILWSAVLIRLHPTLLGMEYPLHIVIILCIVALLWQFVQSTETTSTKDCVLLGTLLVLNFWTRLDSAAYSLMIFAGVGLFLYRTKKDGTRYLKNIALIGLLLLFGAVLYIAVCIRVAGTPAPLSGLVKSYVASEYFANHGWGISLVAHMWWYFLIQSRAVLSVILPFKFGGAQFGAAHALLVAAVLLPVLGTLRSSYRSRHSNPDLFRAAALLAFLYLLGFVHVGVIVATIGHFSWITEHYYGWLFVILNLSTAIAIVHLTSMIRSAGVRRLVTVFALLVFLVPAGFIFWQRTYSPTTRRSYNKARLETAGWINATIPIDAKIGAWNAGVLGYFTDRTIVNLDGLANDSDYFDFLKSKSSIEDYLERENIDYLVDVDVHDMSMQFREKWDHSRWFRGVVKWEDWDVVHQQMGEVPIYVLKKRKIKK